MFPRRASPRVLAATWVAAALLLLPAAARAQSDWRDTAGRVGVGTFDLLVLRPLQTAAVVVGCAAFVPAAVLAAPGGLDAVEEAMEIFVVEPGKRAFMRPLGKF